MIGQYLEDDSNKQTAFDLFSNQLSLDIPLALKTNIRNAFILLTR
jgi:hypothetical protein